MEDLLTTKQLQDMLQVDRVTIYRMLEDGRLRGFKVGGQWRFSRHDIEGWIHRQRNTETGGEPEPAQKKQAALLMQSTLPLTCVQDVQTIFAEACETTAVTLSSDGTNLTEVSSPCEFCRLILSTPEGQRRCMASWRSLGEEQGSSDGQRVCHAGLRYITRTIHVDAQQVALFLVGYAHIPLASDEIRHIAESCGINKDTLDEAARQLPVRPPQSIQRLSEIAQRTADAISEIGHERMRLLKRLQEIAAMTVLD